MNTMVNIPRKVFGSVYIDNQKSIRKQKAWDITNTTTIVDWTNASNLYILLLDTYSSYLKNILRVNTLWSLVISSMTSTIAVTQFTINDVEKPTLALIIKSAIFLTSVITSIITGYIKVEKIQEKIKYVDLTRQKWLHFMLQLSSELQVGAKLRKNAEDIIQTMRSEFNKLSSKRIEVPNNVQQYVSRYLTKRVRRYRKKEIPKNPDKKCHCSNFLCCCCRSKEKRIIDKQHIEFTQQNLSIYKMVTKLLEEELLLLAKIYNDTISRIEFDHLSDLFQYHIHTKDIDIITNTNEHVRICSPVSSDDEGDVKLHSVINTTQNSINNIKLDMNEVELSSTESITINDNIITNMFTNESVDDITPSLLPPSPDTVETE